MKTRARTAQDASAFSAVDAADARGIETVASTKGKKASKSTGDDFKLGGSGASKATELPSQSATVATDLGREGVPNPKDASRLSLRAGGWARVGARILSSNDVEAALRTGDFSKFPVTPRPELLPLYRLLSEALTAHGPNGPYGNGGKLGPVGDQPWNPSELFRAIGEIKGWDKRVVEGAGPGSGKVGVLGAGGAVGSAYAWLDLIYPGLSNQLQPGGLFDDVGPMSRLGVYGDTGPLSTVGLHGYAQDEHGNFIQGRGIVHAITLGTGSGKQRFSLDEKYDAETAAKLKHNDDRWMIRGGLKDGGQTFGFDVKKGDLVKLQVGSESLKDTFEIELVRRGKVIAKADSKTILGSLRFMAESDGHLEVRVKRMDVPPITPSLSDLYIEAVTAPVVLGFGMAKPFLEAMGMKFKPEPEGAVYRLHCTTVSPGNPGYADAAAHFTKGV